MNKYFNKFIEKEYEGNFTYKLERETFSYEKITADYQYDIAKYKFTKKFLDIILKIFGFFVRVFYLNKISGKKHIKELKNGSFITCSNHMMHIDNIFIRSIFKGRKMNILVSEENNAKGIFGKYFRCAGTIPIPTSNLKAFLNFKKYLAQVLSDDKAFLQIYGEKEMWPRYKKPRPLLDGAFSFAYDYKKPILPIFLNPIGTKKMHHLFSVKTYILKPVFPDLNLSKNEAIEKMKNEIEKSYADIYYKINKLDDDVSLYNISKEGYEKLSNHIELQKRCKIYNDKINILNR